MSTKWVVTTAAERIALNHAKQGETTFTVTNPGRIADRVVFQPVPGDGADPDWFTVDEPQRRVLPAASASFLLKVQVPADARPGTYEMQGRVYSSDSAPEESSVLSNRVVFEVAAPPAPAKRKIPWWIIAIAAALVVVTVVVVTLVLTLGGGEKGPAPEPSISAPTSGPIAVPDVAKLKETQALFVLKQAGLKAGTIRHRNDPGRADTIIEQSVAAGTTVAAGSAVNLVVAVKLSAPTPKTPPNTQLKFMVGKLEWDQTEPWVSRWVVNMAPYVCVQSATGTGCNWAHGLGQAVETKSYIPPLRPSTQLGAGPSVVTWNGTFLWSVQAMDDFGALGPHAAVPTASVVA